MPVDLRLRPAIPSLIAALILFIASGASAADSGKPFKVYYRGQENFVLSRLRLDPGTRPVSDLRDAEAAVIQDALPAQGPNLDALKARIEGGMGVVLILGSHIDPTALEYLTDGALKQTGTVEAAPGKDHDQELERLASPIVYVGPAADPIATNVAWQSAVRVHERSRLESHGAGVLVATWPLDRITPKCPILARVRVGKGVIYVLNVWLRQGDQTNRIASYLAMLAGMGGAQNYDFQRWAYFNWLLYYLSRSAAGVSAASFGDWGASPVPNRHDVRILAIAFFSAFVVLLACFLISWRYSRRHPEKLEEFYLQRPTTPQPTSLGAAAIEAPDKPATATAHGDPRWEVIGFHRPLSGFFYNYLLALFIMIPFNLLTTFFIERNYVNPFVEARGAWGAVTQFMLFFFTLLDLGTGQAMVKYFAEYRVREPGRAITYAQFFIWFHALAGIFQVTALGLAAAIWMPHSVVAFMAWFVVLHSLIQFPGFISIFFNLFRALQRFDYSQFLIVLTFVFSPLIQMIFAIHMRHWGLLHPVFGEGMGAVFGFAIGGFVANLLMGAFCAVFYRAVGFKLTTIFLVHFDRDTIKRSVVYGLKLTLGQASAALSWGVIPIILLILIPDFLELNEIWILTFSLTFGYLETGVYIFTTLMPSISESYSHRMIALTRRYLDQGLRWAFMATTMLGGAYVAFSGILVEGLLPPQFMRAAAVMMLMHLTRALDFTTRLPDQVFQGTGRSGLFTWGALVENLSRMVLAWFLIKRYGFPGVFYAFILSSLLKSMLTWPLMVGLVVSPAISLWQTVVNPALAAIANYAVLRTIAVTLWGGPGHAASAWLAVLICLFGSLPLYMFLTGLLGWDQRALDEFRDAAELVPAPFGVLARMVHRLVEFGCSLSPIHDRFPGRLIEAAAGEAQSLTAIKAEMH